MTLHKIYSPITATPFRCGNTYKEYEPCRALKSYIRCFWGTEKPVSQGTSNIQMQSLIIPDTCMDIIFNVDFTNNIINSSFCGINDSSFTVSNENKSNKLISTFAIRFYPWSAVIFSEDSMRDTKNSFFDADCHFYKLKKEMEPLLFEITDIKSRIEVAEKYLLKHICFKHCSPVVYEAVGEILDKKGNAQIDRLSNLVYISTRQMERLFKDNIGISPKRLSTLIRYQYLWNDIVFSSNFQVQDAVFKYGYTDQAHMMREFKRFHTMSVTEAKIYAWQDVAFLQE